MKESVLPLLDSEAYIKRLLERERPGTADILAFYEHRLGAACKNPRLMLMPLDDHLAHRGDGVFDNMKYLDGRIYQFAEHQARMQRGCASLGITPPCPWEQIQEIMLEVARLGGEPNGILRVLIGRGPGGFGVNPAECPEASLYVVAYRFKQKPESWFARGLSAFKSSIPAKSGFLAQVKNTNYLPNVLMTKEANERGFDVPICFNEQGFLAESAVANICLVDENGVFAAPEFSNALPGTTILRAFKLLEGEVSTVVRKIEEAEIFRAKELLMLGTSPDCVSIVTYEGKPVGGGVPGPVSGLLRKRILADIAENGTPVPGLA